MWFLTLLKFFTKASAGRKAITGLMKFTKGQTAKMSVKEISQFQKLIKAFEKKGNKSQRSTYWENEFGVKQKRKWENSQGILALFKKFGGGKTTEPEQEMADNFDSETGWDNKVLSSSWLIAGSYDPLSKALEITTIQGKSYVYPNVGKRVWEAMKQATGKNGSGAGSVFWNLFLRPKNWIHGTQRKFIKENIHPVFYGRERYIHRNNPKQATINIARKVSKVNRSYQNKVSYQKRKAKTMKGK